MLRILNKEIQSALLSISYSCSKFFWIWEDYRYSWELIQLLKSVCCIVSKFQLTLLASIPANTVMLSLLCFICDVIRLMSFLFPFILSPLAWCWACFHLSKESDCILLAFYHNCLLKACLTFSVCDDAYSPIRLVNGNIHEFNFVAFVLGWLYGRATQLQSCHMNRPSWCVLMSATGSFAVRLLLISW